MNSTTENISSDRAVRISTNPSPVSPAPVMSRVFRQMAAKWRESAGFWRGMMAAAVAEQDFHAAIFAVRNVQERLAWADEDEATAVHWEALERHKNDAFA